MIGRLGRALCKMPRFERAVFLAVRLDHLSYAEIAERTGISASEVRAVVARTLVLLDDHMVDRLHRW